MEHIGLLVLLGILFVCLASGFYLAIQIYCLRREINRTLDDICMETSRILSCIYVRRNEDDVNAWKLTLQGM